MDATGTDARDRIGVIGGLLAGILVPIAIHLASDRIAETSERNATRSMQARHLTDLIGPLASDNEKQQLIAVEVANHLAKVGELPSALVPTLVRIAKEGSNAGTALKATEAVVNAAKASESAKQAIAREFGQVSPRVYFHVPRQDLLPRAYAVAASLYEAQPGAHISVPSVAVKAGPVSTELQYFSPSERDEAASIQATLRRLGVEATLVDKSARDSSAEGIRPRHYQLWFGKATSTPIAPHTRSGQATGARERKMG